MSRKLVREEYEELLARVTTRTVEARLFDKFLKENTSWLSAPASTRFHLAYTGGLLEHSVNVARTLLKLKEVLAHDIDEESCIVVGLFHDLGKVGMPDKPYYLDNVDSWQKRNRGIHYVVNKDLVHMDIATRSLYLLASHLPLSDEEAQAVRYHDGQYIRENGSVAHRETKLTRLVQYADNWAGGVIEDGK